MLSRINTLLIVSLTFAALLAATAAGAQTAREPNQRPPETTGSASGSPPGMPQAPVGHRQPRAADLPAATERSPEDQRQMERDREIDKKLWICRGC